MIRCVVLFFLISLVACTNRQYATHIPLAKEIKVGAEQTEKYIQSLKDKRVALFVNHTSMVDTTHLIDLLLKHNIQVTLIFAPEHGLRGNLSAGEHFNNDVDPQTNIPVISLMNKKLSRHYTQQFDVLVCDIQDVGLRFYTYYISMIKLMDLCAKSNKEMMILDRPNPNGYYVDGPILDMKYKSDVGWIPIPVVHGMTLGELAQMVNGEGWLSDNLRCNLTVVPCLNYTHKSRYVLPIAPSPNLPNMRAIYLYASLCYFEGTHVSIGRGTHLPFQVYGHPQMHGKFKFTPISTVGAKNPPLLNKECHGYNLSNISMTKAADLHIHLEYLINAYRQLHKKQTFFTSFFEKLVGVSYVRTMIINNCSPEEIQARWAEDVTYFKKQREPYLLYPE